MKYEKDKGGRPTILDNLCLTLDDFVEVYKEQKSAKATASLLGVDVTSVRTWLHKAGIEPPYDKKRFKTRKKFSALSKWIEAHPTTQLPNNVSEIAKMTGLSKGTIYHYFYRRREAYLRYVKQTWSIFLSNHRSRKIIELGGKKIPVRAIAQIGLAVEKFYLNLKITFLLKNGIIKVFNVSYDYYTSIVKKGSEKEKMELGRDSSSIKKGFDF